MKKILIIIILFIGLFVFNVDAKELTSEEYSELFFATAKNDVYLDHDFEYYLDNAKDRETELQEDADEILSKTKATIESKGLTYPNENIRIFYSSMNDEYTLFSCNLEIDGIIVKSSYGKIIYKDYENYNNDDNELINSLFDNNSIKTIYEIPIDNNNLLDDTDKLFVSYPVYAELEKCIKDTGISYRSNNITYSRLSNTEASAYTSVYLFKNGLYYKTIYINNYYILYIDVPETIEPIIDSYKEYAENEINNYFDYEEEIKLEQMTSDFMGYAHWYGIFEEKGYSDNDVSIVCKDKALIADNLLVEIETSKAGVFANKLTEENNNENYNKMVDYLKSIGYGNILRSYYLIGSGNRNLYIVLDESLNGQLVKILVNNQEFGYTELVKKVENGKIEINILMTGEMIVAYIEGSNTNLALEDIENFILGYYTYAEHKTNEEIISDLEKSIKEEISNSGIDLETLGITLKVVNENGWAVVLKDKTGKSFITNLNIINPKIEREIDTTRSYEVQKTILVRNYVSEDKEEIIELDSKKETKNDDFAKLKDSKEQNNSNKVESIASSKQEAAKKMSKLPVTIISVAVIALGLLGGIYYVRSRYY